MKKENKLIKKLIKENKEIRKTIEEYLDLMMSQDKEITWEFINMLVENELNLNSIKIK